MFRSLFGALVSNGGANRGLQFGPYVRARSDFKLHHYRILDGHELSGVSYYLTNTMLRCLDRLGICWPNWSLAPLAMALVFAQCVLLSASAGPSGAESAVNPLRPPVNSRRNVEDFPATVAK